MSEAYELGVQTALAELEEMFGEEAMEKIASIRERLPRMLGGKPASRITRAKRYLKGKYEGVKKHLGTHKGKYIAGGAGALAGAGGMAAYDRS